MKKIFYIFLVLLVLSTSCSTNEKQQSIIDPDNIGTVTDIVNLSNYLPLYLRSLSAGSSIYYTEIAADYFNPGLGYGNRGGMWYRWEWTSSSNIGIFATCYSGIAQANYVIDLADNYLTEADANGETVSDEDKQSLSDAKAISYFTKAFLGQKLLQYYCENYNSTNIDRTAEGTGIMIVDHYVATSDQSAYPGRSSLVDSYNWVFENLDAAKALLTETSVVGSTLPTKDVCDALKARMYLNMGMYTEAATLAAALVDGGKYPLASTQAEFTSTFTNDSGMECIMQCFTEYNSSLPSSYSYGYVGYDYSNSIYSPDWILSQWVLALYSGTDYRNGWFANRTVTFTPNIDNVVLLNKFPGNPALQPSNYTSPRSDYLHSPKPFRIAEQYLIAAEAYARSGATTPANNYLQALKSKRDPSYTATTLTGDALLQTIKEERALELIGEGFRFFDLKRYGEGMTRTGIQSPKVTNRQAGNINAEKMTVAANDYRWVQPIPQSEIDSNPQIRNQQNRGYVSTEE